MVTPVTSATNEIVALGNPTLQIVGAILFAIAILHTFLVKRFEHIARQYPEGSVEENFFHFLSEAEAVFAIWAMAFAVSIAGTLGLEGMTQYVESRDFTEPIFIFVIMVLASKRPILELTRNTFSVVAKILPLDEKIGFYVIALTLGPLLGSFITEPAAMTVIALVLLDKYFRQDVSKAFKYATIGLLFTNVSIGGTLTNYAAPPVLMVANVWGWDSMYMLTHFGYKAIISVTIGTVIVAYLFRKELMRIQPVVKPEREFKHIPVWVTVFHILFIGGTVYFAHHPTIFMWIFGFALAFYKVTREYQDSLKVFNALLVGVFLAGLIVLGGMQQWWLQPIIDRLDTITLAFASLGLSAIIDNAALTYLGSLVEGISVSKQHAIMISALAGGGLTIIANAPNPAGYSILKPAFDQDEGISPIGLFISSAPFAILALICFWALPNLSG